MSNDSHAPVNTRLQLGSLSVDNLRTLQHLPHTAVEPDLTVLVGQNGGGKTSFIDALSMLLGGDAASEEARSSRERAVTVIGEFHSVDGTESLTVRATDSTRRVQREALQLVHPEFGEVPGRMTIQNLRQAFKSAGVPSPGGTSRAPLVEAATQWVAEQPEADLEERWVDLPPEMANRLPRLTVFRSRDAEDQPGQVGRLVADESRKLLANETYSPRLASVAEDVRRDIDPVLDLIKQMIARYCPGVDDVDVTATFDFSRVNPQIQIRLKQVNGESIDLGEAGSGLAQRVGLAIYAASRETLRADEEIASGAVLAYDEPDTHLDYQAQRELFDIIHDQAGLDHVQVVVATHSVNLIDKVQLRALRHFRLEDERTIVDAPSNYTDYDESAFVSDLASGLGLRNSVILSEKCFLVVEGETEERAVPILFRKIAGEGLASTGVTLINTGGSGSVRRLVEVLIQELGRSVVVLVDQDARETPGRISNDWLTKMDLTEGMSAYFVGAKEFEDAFADQVWLRVAENYFPVGDGQPDWQLAEFSSARGAENGMGDRLVHLFKSRSLRPVRKPEIGEALARTVAREEIPPAIQGAVSATYRMAKETLPK